MPLQAHRTGPILALAFCLALAGTARAGDYWIVANNDHQIELVDPTRVVIAAGRLPRVWSVVVRRTPMASGPAFDYIQEHRELDCARKRTAIIGAVFYTRDGAQVGASSSGSVQWLPVAPKSQGEAVLNFVCAKAGQRRKLGFAFTGLTLQQAIDSIYARWPGDRLVVKAPPP